MLLSANFLAFVASWQHPDSMVRRLNRWVSQFVQPLNTLLPLAGIEPCMSARSEAKAP